MAKEWILNQAMNRWQLNYKKSVGPVAKLIRECQPKSQKEWEAFYHAHVEGRTPEQLEQLGEELYVKITEVLMRELESITKQDCLDYIVDVVIRRTYEGYLTEKEVVKNLVERQLGVQVQEASDEWDRLFGVDYYFVVNGYPIGLQIKPVTFERGSEEYKRQGILEAQHERFREAYGGAAFIVMSSGRRGEKVVVNQEVFAKIQEEIHRLEVLPEGNYRGPSAVEQRRLI